MATFVTYLPDTGKIVAWGTCPDHSLADQAIRGSVVLPIHLDNPDDPWGDTHMVVDEQLVPRPTLAFDKTTILADDQDKATLTGLPDPCTVLVDDTPYEVTGGTLEITSDMPATYEIEIEDPFPAQYFKATIHAVEAL